TIDADAEHRVIGCIRCAGVVVGVDWNLRCALLRGDAAHQRDRPAHGAGGDLGRDSAFVWTTGPGDGALRPCHWPRAGGDRVAPADLAALRLSPPLHPHCPPPTPAPC